MIETNLTTRWEKGIPHHPNSIKLMKSLADLDFTLGGDYFCFKMGGDGDNGEHLMYLMDVHFEREDEAAFAAEERQKRVTAGGREGED